MKIGILTYHCVPNFGAQLQAISTCGFLLQKGYEVVLIHYYPQDLQEMYSNRVPHEQMQCQLNFVEKFLPISRRCYTDLDVAKTVEEEKVDAIFVGSDALFKYVPIKNRRYFCRRKLRYINCNLLSVELVDGNPFFGGFLQHLSNNIPAVAFSVSSQNCPFLDMTSSEKKEMHEALNNYQTITVRDEWTKHMVESITRCTNIRVTPDPVFSFNKSCKLAIPSKQEILEKYNLEDNYILLCFSTWYIKEKYVHELAKAAMKKGYSPIAFPMPEGLNRARIEKQIPLPLNPLDWYALIKYSSGYIGERMHPILVCIHNVVPFYCFDEYGIYTKSFWGLRKKYISDSSKTFHIVNKAGLSKWLFSYKGESNLPNPSYVIQQIMEFDSQSCSTFARTYEDYYNIEMNSILNALGKNINTSCHES